MTYSTKYNWEWLKGTENFSECLKLRTEVFVEEQKFEKELDNIDPKAEHLLLKLQDKAIGTARIFTEDGNWVIGRICVSKDYRGLGIGNLLLDLCEKKIKKEGGSSAILHAQLRVSNFYEKAGYSKFGEIYFDEYCEHIPMKKQF